jgi:hypothetical protein
MAGIERPIAFIADPIELATRNEPFRTAAAAGKNRRESLPHKGSRTDRAPTPAPVRRVPPRLGKNSRDLSGDKLGRRTERIKK